jgi:hypothetical protein
MQGVQYGQTWRTHTNVPGWQPLYPVSADESNPEVMKFI